MKKIILDTNIIVSALISNSHPKEIVFDFVFEKKVQLCISQEIIDEYKDVIKRPKFDRFQHFRNNADIVLNKLIELGIEFHPKEKIYLISDLADNKFLELAKESQANFLVTGNSNDFTFNKFENTFIVSPKDFLELYK